VRHHVLMTIWLALGMLSAAGCTGQGQRFDGDRVTAPLGTISIYQLAGSLGMDVAAESPCGATLRDSANTVMIYPDPDGQAYVNGVPVGRPGGIKLVGDTLFVPRATAEAIRPALARGARRPMTPARPVRSARPVRLGRVVIDPGHGGQDPGAISVLGTHEKSIVLAASLTAAAALEDGGGEVLLTRGDDRYVPLNDRAEFSNRSRADLFVSIHADSAENASACGFTIYVARSCSDESLRLAEAIERRMNALGIASRGIRRADYRVLVRTNCPAVLVELGYLSNRGEAARLARREYRDALAGAVAAGVLDHLRGR